MLPRVPPRASSPPASRICAFFPKMQPQLVLLYWRYRTTVPLPEFKPHARILLCAVERL